MTVPALQRTGVLTVAVLLSGSIGVSLAQRPVLWLPYGLALSVLAVTLSRPRSSLPLAVVILLVGCLGLGYGFSNVPALPGLPVPFSDIVLAGLFLLLWRESMRDRTFRVSLVIVAAFIVLATVRLALDWPDYGLAAVRDWSVAPEMIALPTGLAIARRLGHQRTRRLLTISFAAVALYGLSYPLAGVAQEHSPVVGLQKSVPLLGWYSAPGLLFALFFFVLIRPLGRASYLFAAATLPTLAMMQLRGAYLAAAVASLAIACWVMKKPSLLAPTLQRAASMALPAAAALVLVFVTSPTGRLGDTSLTFARMQLTTLGGGSGPGAGSIEHRREWFNSSITRLNEQPESWVFGLGLGTDLADGFRAYDALAVRKPHNDFLEVTARFGVVGTTFLLALILYPLWSVARAFPRLDVEQSWFILFVVGTTAISAVFALTQPFFAYPHGAIPTFLLLGFALAVVAPRPSIPRVPDR